MELVSDYEAYEQQIRLIKQLKSEGATKAKLRSAAATLAELKRRGKSRTNVKSHETIPPGQSSEDFLKIYREHFHIIPTDEDGFTVSFVLSSGDLKQDTEEEARARVFFDQFGFVVFRDVIDSSSCENSQQEIWKFLEKKTRRVPTISTRNVSQFIITNIRTCLRASHFQHSNRP